MTKRLWWVEKTIEIETLAYAETREEAERCVKWSHEMGCEEETIHARLVPPGDLYGDLLDARPHGDEDDHTVREILAADSDSAGGEE